MALCGDVAPRCGDVLGKLKIPLFLAIPRCGDVRLFFAKPVRALFLALLDVVTLFWGRRGRGEGDYRAINKGILKRVDVVTLEIGDPGVNIRLC